MKFNKFKVIISLVGLVNYLVLMGFVVLSIKAGKKIFRYLSLLQTLVGLVVSVYLMYLQFFVIGSICLYCTASALISFGLFYFIWTKFSGERKRLAAIKINVLYKHFIKNILFLIDPEVVHANMLVVGEFAGKSNLIRKSAEIFLKSKDTRLSQKIYGIGFDNPIGLAAGFDYEARLTQFLPSLNFGFMSVGTVTNMPYEGNPKPMLGRLPMSKSLMVNKGFKSSGSINVASRLRGLDFKIPFGILKSNPFNLLATFIAPELLK